VHPRSEPPRPPTTDSWVQLTDQILPVETAISYVEAREVGGIVSFVGTVRDHAPGRPGVSAVEYEAFDVEAERRMERIAAMARHRWPELGRIVLLHRVGRLRVGEAAVVVVTAAPHRDEAFGATRWCIDMVKATVPLWKRETWSGGSDWGVASVPIRELSIEPAGSGPPGGAP
jgi:molybdopterin synthase catalytic subunit